MLRRCTKQVLSCTEWKYLLCQGQFNRTARVLYSTFDKDLPNPNLPTPISKTYSHDTDILLDQLKRARSIDKILELTSSHLNVMNAQHLVTSLNGIHDMCREATVDPKQLMENLTFQSMCSRVMKIVRLLDTEELITVYKVLSTLGVRSNSFVMQSVLKMLGGHLNNMNLGQLTFLSFLLSKQRHNSLVDGLRLALPLVLQVQIEQQLDSENMTEVVSCLNLACKSRLKPSAIQKIVDTIKDKAKTLSPANALTVVFSLMNLETPVDGYKELLNYCFEVVTNNIETLNKKQIISTVHICRTQSYYNSSFFFEVANKVVSDKWDLNATWDIVRHLTSIGFCPEYLMDHFVSALCMESETLKTGSSYCPLSCIESLTTSGYRPLNYELVLEMLCSCDTKLKALNAKSPFLLLKFVGCLAMMGHFPERLTGKVLNEEFLLLASSSARKQGRSNEFEKTMFTLIWSLDVYNQKNRFTVPPTVLKSLTQRLFERYSDLTCPLQKFIENGLGGSQFIQNSVFTYDGLLVDHVLAMRSGNYPVSLQHWNSSQLSSKRAQGLTFIEDLELPADAKIVTVLVAREDHYCRDPEVLRGFYNLKMKALSKKKYSPVVINFANWRNLPDREKIPFLMHEIKRTVEDESIEKTTSML